MALVLPMKKYLCGLSFFYEELPVWVSFFHEELPVWPSSFPEGWCLVAPGSGHWNETPVHSHSLLDGQAGSGDFLGMRSVGSQGQQKPTR